MAQKRHVALLARLANEAKTLIVYTDGSSIPNPGRIGYGVVMLNQGQQKTMAQAVGIGSNLTAELCGLRRALAETLAVANSFSRAFIFCDCLMAIDLALSSIEPNCHFELVRDIREAVTELRGKILLEILWVPAHVGVPGNELANDAAKMAATAVLENKPIDGQPKVPLAVVRAILKQGQRERWQQKWIAASVHKFQSDHLFRIKPAVAKTPVFFRGKRAEQTTLARLRLGHCRLAAHSARWQPEVQRVCDCARESERVGHFLLRCPIHAECRRELMDEVATVYDGVVTEELLLGTENAAGRLSMDQKCFISRAVFAFVERTNREI